VFVELSAGLVPAPEPRRPPISLLERLADDGAAAVAKLLA
jgi:hypothetical protein